MKEIPSCLLLLPDTTTHPNVFQGEISKTTASALHKIHVIRLLPSQPISRCQYI